MEYKFEMDKINQMDIISIFGMDKINQVDIYIYLRPSMFKKEMSKKHYYMPY